MPSTSRGLMLAKSGTRSITSTGPLSTGGGVGRGTSRRGSPLGTGAGRADRPRTPTRCRGRVRTPRRTSRRARASCASWSSSRQSCSTRSGATLSSMVPPSAAARIAIFLKPAVRSSTAPDAIDAEGVGDDPAGHHDLAEPPARLDQLLVALVDRVLREHHAGRVGVEQRLHDDADARTREEAHPLAVGDRRVGVRRPPDLAHCRRSGRRPTAR